MEVIVTATGNSLRFEEWWPPLIVRKSHMYMYSTSSHVSVFFVMSLLKASPSMPPSQLHGLG